MRLEKDSLGELEVPDEAYYGVQTVRCSGNYKIGNHTYNEFPDVIRAMAEIKKACAITNSEIGALNHVKAEAICKAADELIAGKFAGHFPVNVWRSQGTGVNMNVNEVIANRANEILTGKRAYDQVHPNTHVNMCQSSNDVFPTAEAIVLYRLIDPLVASAKEIEKTLEVKARDFKSVVRLGRTGLQDALPMTWGQVFAGWLRSVQRAREQLESLKEVFSYGVLGGTAVGTGMGVMPGYPERIFENLSKVLGFTMKQKVYADEVIPNSGIFDGMRNTDHHSVLMEVVKELVASVTRIANDLLLYASGPRSGINEVKLPMSAEGTQGYEHENTAYLCEMMTDVLGEMVIAVELVRYAGCLPACVDRLVAVHRYACDLLRQRLVRIPAGKGITLAGRGLVERHLCAGRIALILVSRAAVRLIVQRIACRVAGRAAAAHAAEGRRYTQDNITDDLNDRTAI